MSQVSVISNSRRQPRQATSRSRYLQLPYGDQALFMKKSVFEAMGGFAELPIMEDFVLVRRLRRQGKIAILPARDERMWSRRQFLKLSIAGLLGTTGIFSFLRCYKQKHHIVDIVCRCRNMSAK